MEEYNPQFDGENPQKQYVTYIPFGMTPEEYENKKKIKRSALCAGICFTFITLFSVVWALCYYFVMGKLGFTSQKAYEIISEPAVLQVVQVVLSSFMFTVPFIFVYKAGGERISDIVALKKPVKGMFLPYFLIGAAVCIFANLSVSSAGQIFERFGINYSVDDGGDPKGLFGFLLMLISTAIVPPLVEEFACRGVLLGSLKKYGESFAIIVSALLFGTVHGNFDQMPFAFIVGLILGFITVKTGTIAVSIAVHSFNNLVSVVYSYLNLSNDLRGMLLMLLYSIVLIFGTLGVFLLCRRDENAFSLKSDSSGVAEKLKYKWFFTSPAIIIFIVICLINAVRYFN